MSKTNENKQEVVISVEEQKEMEEIIAEEVIANDVNNEQVREIITCKNIQMGEEKNLTFKGVFRLSGKFIPKDGRPLSFDELEKEMPEMFEAIENMEGRPSDIIDDDKEFTSELTVASNEERALRKLNANIQLVEQESGKEVAELVKKQLLEKREVLKQEIKKVEEMGVIWNENIVWDIWMIQRGRRQRAYLKREGLPVDYLIKLYSYIPKKEYDKLKKHYQKQFN